MNVPIVHIEAGLRSFDMRMPEERNRVIADRFSKYLIVPSVAAQNNLITEGFPHTVNVFGKNTKQQIFNFGDMMFDSFLQFNELRSVQMVNQKNYVLLTLHREQLFTDKQYYQQVLKSVTLLAKTENVVFPAHPRIYKNDKLLNDFRRIGVNITPALDYIAMQDCIANSKFVVTDSGGLQKEAYFHKRFCITMRENTEWIETLDGEHNQLVGSCFQKFSVALEKCQFKINNDFKFNFKPIYGDGKFCNRLVNLLLEEDNA